MFMHALPFSLLDSAEWRALMDSLNRSAPVLNRHKLKELLETAYKKHMKSLTSAMTAAQSIAVSMDGSEDYNKSSVLNIV